MTSYVFMGRRETCAHTILGLTIQGLIIVLLTCAPGSAATCSGDAGAGSFRTDIARDAAGGDTLTLDGMIALGRTHNAGLTAARLRATAAEARIDQAEAWDDPRLSVEFYSIPVARPNPFTENMEYDYALEQMIPFPGKKRLMGDMERAGARMAAENAAMSELRLIADIRAAHAMLWAAIARRAILEETRTLALQINESVQSRYAVARATQSDVLRAQTETAKLANDLASAAADVRGSEAMLNALLGRDPALAIIPADPPDTMLTRVAGALPGTVAERPDLRAMREEAVMNRAERDAMKRELLPDFMIRAMYKQMLMGEPDYWSLMIGVNIPIAPWSRARYDKRAEEAETKARAVEEALTDMRRMVEARVREAHARALALRERAARMREVLLPQSRQAFEVTLAAYRAAGTDFTAVLDSYRMVAMVRMDEAMAMADYATAIARLAYEAGVGVEVLR